MRQVIQAYLGRDERLPADSAVLAELVTLVLPLIWRSMPNDSRLAERQKEWLNYAANGVGQANKLHLSALIQDNLTGKNLPANSEFKSVLGALSVIKPRA